MIKDQRELGLMHVTGTVASHPPPPTPTPTYLAISINLNISGMCVLCVCCVCQFVPYMLRVCLSVGCVVENKIILQSGEISATSIIIHIIIHISLVHKLTQAHATFTHRIASRRNLSCVSLVHNMTQEPAMRRDE